MRRLLCACAAIALIAPSQAVAQNFPDIPDNHWVYDYDFVLPAKVKEHVRFLSMVGLLEWHVEYHFSWGSPWKNSARDLLRIDLSRELTLLSDNLDGLYTSRRDEVNLWKKHLPVSKELVKVLQEDWIKRPRGISDPETIKLIKERTDWLKAIQSTIEIVEIQFASAGTPVDQNRFELFNDQPKRHWAGKAIKRMREVGILFGYPDGTFRG